MSVLRERERCEMGLMLLVCAVVVGGRGFAGEVSLASKMGRDGGGCGNLDGVLREDDSWGGRENVDCEGD